MANTKKPKQPAVSAAEKAARALIKRYGSGPTDKEKDNALEPLRKEYNALEERRRVLDDLMGDVNEL